MEPAAALGERGPGGLRCSIRPPEPEVALMWRAIDAVSAPKRLGSLIHIPQTLPAILLVIVAAVGGAIVALIALAAIAPAWVIGAAAATAFALVLLIMGAWNRRSIKNSPPSLAPRFPSPHGG